MSLFTCLLAAHLSSTGETTLQFFCPFCNWVGFVFVVETEEFVYVLDPSPVLDMWLANISSHLLSFHFLLFHYFIANAPAHSAQQCIHTVS